MLLTRRALIAVAIGGLLGGAASTMAQSWPAKPIRLVIGFAPGGAADYVARTIADPLGRLLGQSVVVENRAGAGSSLAADFVAKAPADGYTVLIASPSSISVNPALNAKLTYSAKDLVPVTRITSSPLVVAVHPGAGINSFQELIATAKAKPGALNYTSSGNGSAPHLGAAHFSKVAGVEMVHIPYKGGAPAIQAVIAGDAQLTFGTPPSVLPMVQAGRLKALAVTSPNRSSLVPDVPGTIEAGLAGLQHVVLVRLLRAGRHAARGDEEALRCGPAGHAARRREGRARARRDRGRAVEVARGIRGVPRRGQPLLGSARQGSRREGRVNGAARRAQRCICIS